MVIRSGYNWLHILCVLAVVTGCACTTDRDVTTVPVAPTVSDGSPSTSTCSAPEESKDGPYMWLLRCSAQELEDRLGKPARVDSTFEDTVKKWVYPEKGLKVAVWKNAGVMWIDQTKGKITNDMHIGDSEAVAAERIGRPFDASTGQRIIRVDEEQFSLEIHLKDGRVTHVQILHPDSEI